jgi:hypothetical protein
MSEYKIGDYNRGGYIAFMGSMAFTLAFFIYIAFIHPGVDLHEIQAAQSQKQDQQKEAPVAQPDAQPAQEPAPEAK